VAPGAPPIAPPAAEAEASERETTIKEEGRLMGLAADTLRRGDAAGALAQLELIQARFPRGGLVQEREVRMIEALARAGRGAEASTRAAAFLKAHPDSVLTYRVQPYVH
jgi:outer membrane protein assembly factor BamD (BamD/ComL family)